MTFARSLWLSGSLLYMIVGWVKVSLSPPILLITDSCAENCKPLTEDLKELMPLLRENSLLCINLRVSFQMSFNSNTPGFLKVKGECQLHCASQASTQPL